MDLKLDLNLLKVLVLLNEHRQLKPVAKALGKTESAVSKYLARLRLQLNDPLFVRGPKEFEPTDYMTNLIPVFSSSLDAIHTAVVNGKFDPKEYQRDIVLALPSVVQYWVGEPLLTDLMDTFPKAKISMVSWDKYSKNELLENRIDIGAHYFNPELPKSIYQHELGHFMPQIVVSDKLDVKDVESALKLPFIMLATKGTSYYGALSSAVLQRHGVDIDIKGIVDNVTCLLSTVKTKKCASVLHSFGNSLDGLKIIPFPKGVESNEFPKSVAFYRTVNRDHPLQKILLEHLQRYIK